MKKAFFALLIMTAILLSACAQSAPVTDIADTQVVSTMPEEPTAETREEATTVVVETEEPSVEAEDTVTTEETEDNTVTSEEGEEASAESEEVEDTTTPAVEEETEDTEATNKGSVGNEDTTEPSDTENTEDETQSTDELTEEELKAILDAYFNDDLGGTNPRVDVGDGNGENDGNDNDVGDNSGEEQKPESNYGYDENGVPYVVSDEQVQNTIDYFVANYKNSISFTYLDEEDLSHLDENLNCIQNNPELSNSVMSNIESYKLGILTEEEFLYVMKRWIEGGGLYGTGNIIVH